MNTLKFKSRKVQPLVLALVGALVLGQDALASSAPSPTASLREEITTTPGRSISPTDEELVSSAANKVLFHISKARDAIRKRDTARARSELGQVDKLIEIINSVTPTTVIKDHLWTADKKLSYENTEEVGPSMVPIYASLGVREVFDPAQKKATRGNAKQKSGVEEEAVDSMLYYEELDLPLRAVQHFLSLAEGELGRNRPDEADQALRAAQDSVDFVGVFLPEPLLAARVNLERAYAHYNAGKLAEAKIDVSTAIGQLEAAGKSADTASKADVDKLLSDARSLQTRLDQGATTLGSELHSLWRHTEAMADRAMASTAVGWAKLRQHDPLRTDLIEAKRYVAYADIDANVDKAPVMANAALVKAKEYLDRAAGEASGKAELETYIKDAKAVVDSLLAGQSKADPGEMSNLKSLITQALGKV